MEDHPPRRARLLEFAMAAAFIGVASLFLIDAMSDLQEEAERLTVETTVRNMNSGLFLRQAELMISGRERELPKLALGNPVEWLEAPPPGYSGERGCADSGPSAAGEWCWNAAARRLHYRPRRTDSLKVEGGRPILTWRVHAPADPSAIRPGSMRVVAERSYDWRPHGSGR